MFANSSQVYHDQNAARQRALEFGHMDIVHSLDSSVSSVTDSIQASSPSIVVTSKTTEDKVKDEEALLEDRLKASPRGFFADQFEARYNDEVVVCHANSMIFRIGATMMHILMARGLKSGDRRMVR